MKTEDPTCYNEDLVKPKKWVKREFALFLLSMKIHPGSILQLEEGYHQDFTMLPLWSWISRLQNLRNKKVKVAQLCPTLCDPMDYTVHGILQARILEWVAFFFSGGSSHPRDQIQVSHIAGKFFMSWAIREALRNKYLLFINLQPPPHPVCGTLL